MPNHTQMLGWVAMGVLLAGVALLTYYLAAVPPVVAPSLGPRGQRRRQAIKENGLFAAFEPAIRKVASWIGSFDLETRRQSLDETLRSTGFVLGVSADEFMAIQVLSALGSGGLSWMFCTVMEKDVLWVPFVAVVGFILPLLRVEETGRQRCRLVTRGLPPAIDLLSLCMGAGSDFPSALRFVVNEGEGPTNPVCEEFAHILQRLELGHTRVGALRQFATRVPTDAVKDFVSAVVQAEEKGNPLAEVLSIQAKMTRMRRSVAAEEAAAKAGVMLIGPLMILLCAILVILFGPFAINGIGF